MFLGETYCKQYRLITDNAFLFLVLQVVFIGTSYATLYLMYFKFKATYDKNHDTFRIEFLLIPVTLLALIINHEFSLFEVSVVCVAWLS